MGASVMRMPWSPEHCYSIRRTDIVVNEIGTVP